MNRIKIIVLMMGVCFSGISQEKYTKYKTKFLTKEMDVLLTNKKDYKLWIDCQSYDPMTKEGGILINKSNHSDFVESLKKAKEKYEEWIGTAKENNVSELTKEMKILQKVDVYFKYSDWQFSYNQTLGFRFQVIPLTDGAEYCLILSTGSVASSSNEFIKTKGFNLSFTSSGEIQSFIDLIAEEKVKEFLSKPNVKDKFKD